MTVSLGELATRFGCELVGNPETRVTHVATLGEAGAGAVCFFANEGYRGDLLDTGASAVILKASDADDCPVDALVSANPYAVYARVAALLHPQPAHVPGVHPSAVVDKSARIAASAHVAALAYVGAHSEIGENVYVGPSCVIGDRCSIANGTKLLARATLVEDVRIGERSIIHPGAVIGGDGFGNAMTPSGWLKVPQLGGVRIGNDVEIGCNTTIDRGTIGDTVIDDGVRLDNLIQIAHNVMIGEHTAIAAMVAVAGSARIGKRCMLAGKAGVQGHIRMCDDVIVMGNSMITKDVREPGVYSGMFAAEKDRVWKRRVGRFRRLEDMAQRLAELERADKDNE